MSGALQSYVQLPLSETVTTRLTASYTDMRNHHCAPELRLCRRRNKPHSTARRSGKASCIPVLAPAGRGFPIPLR